MGMVYSEHQWTFGWYSDLRDQLIALFRSIYCRLNPMQAYDWKRGASYVFITCLLAFLCAASVNGVVRVYRYEDVFFVLWKYQVS